MRRPFLGVLPFPISLFAFSLGLVLVVQLALPAECGFQPLFYDDFSRPLLNASGGQWIAGPFLVPSFAKRLDNSLTFNRVTIDPIGGGDIFTVNRFSSPTGFFRLSFAFRGLPGCDRAFMGWYTIMPKAEDYNSTVYGHHGWLASTDTTYCTVPVNMKTCDQSFIPLRKDGNWATYVMEPALEALTVYQRNETAIAQGIYLTIESLGTASDNVCFFDNVTLEALVPSNTASISSGLVDVDFDLDSPSFTLQPPSNQTITTQAVSGNFVRMVELDSTNNPAVMRYMPAVNYSIVDSDSDKLTFSNILPLYGARRATCEITFQTFAQAGLVLTGLSNFTAPKDSVEWSLTVRDWPFQKSANKLLLDFNLAHFDTASSNDDNKSHYVIEAVEFISQERINRYTLRAVTTGGDNANLVMNVTIPLVATIDGVARHIEAPVLTTASALASLLLSSAPIPPVSTLQSAKGDPVDTIVFVFPSFNKSLTYDPNLGLLLTGAGKSGSSTDDDHTLLIVLTTVLVSCALLIVVVAAVATFVAMKIKASKSASQEACVQLDQVNDRIDHDAL